MSINDADGEGSPYPHQRPPGLWRITRSGVTGWSRELSDGSMKVLPLGRGPLRASMLPGRWWPDDFRFEPGYNKIKLPSRRSLRTRDCGWVAIEANSDQLGQPINQAEAGWADLPAGTTDVVIAGLPARPIAYCAVTGEAWWWDPVEATWCSWGLVSDHPGEAKLAGCADGALLIVRDAIVWLLADHSEGILILVTPGTGQPLAAPTLFADALIWPASVDGQLRLWQLQLPPRIDGRADAQRYAVFPKELPLEAVPAPVAHAFGRTTTSSNLAVFPARHGHVLLRRMGSGQLVAQWHPCPDGWILVERLSPWLRPDGRFELQARSAEQAIGRLIAGGSQVNRTTGLCATLGQQRWRGRARVDDNDLETSPYSPPDGHWLLPLAETADGAVMLDCDDATAQSDLLLGETNAPQQAQLTLLSGNILVPLAKFLTLRELKTVKVAGWRHQLLIYDSADRSRAILLETPLCASSWG